MKSFALASVAVVASVDAFSLQEFIADFPVTKAQARAKYGPKYQTFSSSKASIQAYEQAHSNIQAQRERLGMTRIGADPKLGQSTADAYRSMTGLSAFVVGVAQGLSYNPNAGSGTCFNAVSSSVLSASNLTYVLRHIYLPFYLPELQLVLQDNIALMAGFYTDCDVNKFFDSMTTLISAEGSSSLMARAGGSYMFDFQEFKKTWADESASTFDRGASFGKLFGAVTNYHI